MRISDWSSDVCSSDLKGLAERGPEVLHRVDLLPLALHANDYSIIFSHTLKIKHIKTPNRNPLRSTLISRSGNSAALPPFDWGWQRSIGGGAAVCPAIRCRPAPPRKQRTTMSDFLFRPRRIDRKSTRMNSRHYCEDR